MQWIFLGSLTYVNIKYMHFCFYQWKWITSFIFQKENFENWKKLQNIKCFVFFSCHSKESSFLSKPLFSPTPPSRILFHILDIIMGNTAQKRAQSLSLGFSPIHWNTGLVSSEASLTSRGEGASLALSDNPSIDGVKCLMR